MTAISDITKQISIVDYNTQQIHEEIKEKHQRLMSFKCKITMSYNDFKALFLAHAQRILIQRSITAPYVIDKNNGPVIKQLYLYFTNNPECKWNLNAGLVFGGKVGCGKSVMMTSYLLIADEFSNIITYRTHSKKLGGLISKHGIEYFEKRPLFIDELGREESITKDWGKVIKPMIDLFALRSEAGSRSYATTNFNWTSLEKFYGEFIRNRMEEMMTFVVVPGESRRLKNEIRTK